MSSAIIFGIVAALAYGTANFVARFSGKSLGVLATLVWSQLFLLACTTIIFFVFGRLPHLEAKDWALLIASNVAIAGGTVCLYAGLANGRLSIVAPVMATYGAVTAVVSMVAGDRPSAMTYIGLGLTVIGAVLSAIPSESSQRTATEKPSGIGFAIGSALLFGLGYWLQGNHVIPNVGPLATIWLCYITASVLFTSVALLRKTPLFTFGGPKDFALLLGTAALSGSGFGAMMVAQSSGDVSVATALSSAATTITVLLAFTVLREKPSWKGWLGIGAVVAGVITLQLGGG